MPDLSFDARAARAGALAIAPLAAPGIPFGLVLGLVISDGGIDRLAGWSSSFIIIAGAAQLIVMSQLIDGASAAVIIVSVALINSRHVMYSAALRPRVAEFPSWFRVIGPYFLLDQVFAVADARPAEMTDRERLWHYMGSAFFIWPMWVFAVSAGILFGDVIDESWSLDFAVPLMFGGLMVLAIRDRPGVLAAVVAATVAVVGKDLPQGSGLLLGILVGVAAGGFAESRLGGGGDT